MWTAWRGAGVHTLPAPPYSLPPPHYRWLKPLFIMHAYKQRKQSAVDGVPFWRWKEMFKKKSIVTFGHVSPRTLRSKVPAKSFPPWNGVMRFTVDPTSRFPAGTNLARMVRRASPFWIFCHVSFNISYPLSLSLPRTFALSLPLSVSHSLARSAAHVTPPWARERERTRNRAGLQALLLRHVKASPFAQVRVFNACYDV